MRKARGASGERALAGALALVLAAGLGVGGSASPEEVAGPASPQVSGAWARPAAAGATGAVYLELANPAGGEALVLTGAATDVAKFAELHETRLETRTGEGGQVHPVMTMRPAGPVVVPAGERLHLQPGGLHIMLVGLTRALQEGDTFLVTLFCEGRAPLSAQVRVGTPAGGEGAAGHAGHGP